MPLTLSWDLIVIVFFAVIVAYSFIVGKDESVKIIISSYISIVAVQAIGNLLSLLSSQSTSVMDLLGFGLSPNVISIVKLILFVVMIIFLAIRGGFEMQYAKEISGVWEPVVTGAFGFATAGLLLTALLTYVAAKPLLDFSLSSAPLIQPLLRDSTLVQYMVDYQNVWFCLPAVLLLGVGIAASWEK
jgi:hypothetical protein